jgi:molybdopterin molybdotransferase
VEVEAVSIAAAPEAIGFAEARARVLAAAASLPDEAVPLESARGRALRQAVVADHDLPPFRNASMDGVAVRSSDTTAASAHEPVRLRVQGEIMAGVAPARPVDPGACVWIMTGAPVPEGADAVVPVEDLEPEGGPDGERVRLRAPAAQGLNLRDAGADVRAGERVFAAGRELSPHDLAVLASLGVARPRVGRRPRVAAFSTGDELLDADQPLRPGAIRDGNRPMLGALLEESGAIVHSSERLADDVGTVARRIARALGEADVVITIGGISAGRRDPVKEAIASIPGIARWRVAMKPGRPQAFGTPESRLFFGLPGNPASVACVFEALVRPALRKLQGFTTLDRPLLTARAAEAIASRAGRTDFVRVTLERRGEEWWAREAGASVSGHVLPQARAHALLIVPEARERLAPGESAEAMLLRWPDAE